jgi:hypothetical protein
MPRKRKFHYVLLDGGYTGDGSEDHRIIGLSSPKIPCFATFSAAKSSALSNGKFAFIAKIVAVCEPTIRIT